MRDASPRAAIARRGWPGEDESNARNDKLASKNESAVTGDMCPTGVLFNVQFIWKPRRSDSR